jgi:hypothetical protein
VIATTHNFIDEFFWQPAVSEYYVDGLKMSVFRRKVETGHALLKLSGKISGKKDITNWREESSTIWLENAAINWWGNEVNKFTRKSSNKWRIF